MSRPIVLMAFAMMVGIIAADILFYQCEPVPMWLQPAAWGFCFVLTLVAAIFYRREARVGALLRYSAFPVITVLFFMVVAFSRYAAVAERQQQQWAAVGKPVMHGNPDEFDFARWCWVTGRSPQYQPTAPTPSGLRGWGLQVRTRLLERLASLGMEEQTMALVAATALGDRTLLRRDTRDLYSRVGASHLLALSGLHLGIIVGLFLTWMNGRLLLSRWRWPVGMMVLLFIWTYTFVAGMPTSLLRAALMTSIFVLASLMQRYGSPLQHLLLAAIVMMLWRPTVVFDVGAQLSFLAVAGILLFYRPLYMWFFDRWRYQIFWMERYYLLWPFTTLAVSLCAQVLTLPLVAYYFHQIPTYGTLLSIVLIPLTTLFLMASLLLIVLSWLWPLAASWLSVGVSWLVAFQLWIMSHVAQWPGAVIPDFWSRKASPQVVVYHNRRCPALHLIASPSQSWLLVPQRDSLETGMYYIRRDFWLRRLTAEPVVLDAQGVALSNGFKVVMLKDGGSTKGSRGSKGSRSSRSSRGAKAVDIDMLWLVRGFRGGTLGDLPVNYSPRVLVLDASLAKWQREALAKEAARVGWRCYDVAAQGALRVRLETQVKNERMKSEE